MQKVETHFLNMLIHWLDFMHLHNKQFPFAHRKTHIIQTAFLLIPVSDLKLGRALKSIMEFQRRLGVILRECEDAWQDMFIYALAHAQAPQLLRCFLAFHHFVFQSKRIGEMWSRTENMLWDKFSLGMWRAIGGDPKFCARCANFEQAKKLFVFASADDQKPRIRTTKSTLVQRRLPGSIGSHKLKK
jgi:hypothetical protein